MTAYVYWKEEPPQRVWKPIHDTPEARQEAIDQGAMFFTWASVSELVSKNGLPEPHRRGDLPIDLDCAEDPEKALQDLKALCLVHLPDLYGIDPYGIEYYASGSKGFHAVIPARLLDAQDGDPLLPLIYKRMVSQWASDFELTTLDHTMYAMHQGKMFRIANVKRNNGHYKVPLTLEEVRDLGIDDLIKLTTLSRQIEPVDADVSESEELGNLFRMTRAAVHEELKEAPKAKPVSPETRKRLRKDVAPCIAYIVSAMPAKTDRVNFNRLLMIVVNYCHAVNLAKADAWTLVKDFVTEYPHSETYPTAEGRVGQFKVLWHYCQNNPNYSFSCNRVLGLHLPGNAFECSDCPQGKDKKCLNTEASETTSQNNDTNHPKNDHRDQPGKVPGKDFHLTELGNAERFAADHLGTVRYSHEWRSWFVWTGKYWKRDTTGLVKAKAKVTVRKIYQEASRIKDKDQRERVAKHAASSESHYRIRAMIELAASEPGIPVEINDLDKHPMLLACQNGTLDLATGELREPDPDDLITKVVPVKYDPEALCPLWEAFLDRILSENGELLDYIQKVVGYCLTGDIREQCLFFLYGLGANGKSTFLNVLRALLPDHFRQVPVDTFLVTKNSSIPNDLAMLKGARIASLVEVEFGKRLAEALVKSVTGGDPITARFMRQEFFQYDAEFKLLLAANHKPVIYGTDYALWRRIRMVPFTIRIPPEEQDPQLADTLKMDLPGILAWAVRGCLAWQKDGLGMPEAVKNATEEYKTEMDILGSFLEIWCEYGARKRVKKADLFEKYETWCEEEQEKPISKRAFGLRMKERGITDKRDKKDRYWMGLCLRSGDGW